MRGIPHPDSPEGQRLGTRELVLQGDARRAMGDAALAADLSKREAAALLACHDAERLCRGETAMRLQLAGLLGVPAWADSVSVARHTTKRGITIERELRSQSGARDPARPGIIQPHE